jgi:hypothetical protein
MEGCIAAKANLYTDLERTGVHRIPFEWIQNFGVAQTEFFGNNEGGDHKGDLRWRRPIFKMSFKYFSTVLNF